MFGILERVFWNIVDADTHEPNWFNDLVWKLFNKYFR